MSTHQQTVTWLAEIMPKCKISKESNQVLSNPFFTANPSDISILDHLNSSETSPELTQVETKLRQLELLETPLGKLYLLLGQTDLDFVYHHTTCLSLDEISKRYQVYCDNGQTDLLDIGITYHGMGHVNVLTYSRSEQTFFFRMDGGSNGYDREDNWKYVLQFQASELSSEERYTTEAAFLKLLQPVDAIPTVNF